MNIYKTAGGTGARMWLNLFKYSKIRFHLVMKEWFCPSFLFVQPRWETSPSAISVTKPKNIKLHFILFPLRLLGLLFTCRKWLRIRSGLAAQNGGLLFCRTHMEGVDFRIRPVDQLLGEVAPFYHQPVYLQRKVYVTYT